MTIFEMESWRIFPGKYEGHERLMRHWLQWVNYHRELRARAHEGGDLEGSLDRVGLG
jgi:hypothetical protein